MTAGTGTAADQSNSKKQRIYKENQGYKDRPQWSVLPYYCRPPGTVLIFLLPFQIPIFSPVTLSAGVSALNWGVCPQPRFLPSIKVAALTFHAYMAHFIMPATGDGPSIRCFPCNYATFRQSPFRPRFLSPWLIVSQINHNILTMPFD